MDDEQKIIMEALRSPTPGKLSVKELADRIKFMTPAGIESALITLEFTGHVRQDRRDGRWFWTGQIYE